MQQRKLVVVGGGITKFSADRVDANLRDLVIEDAAAPTLPG